MNHISPTEPKPEIDNQSKQAISAQDKNLITLTKPALERIIEIKKQAQNSGKFLRLTIQGGGCSGFQYVFALDDQIAEQDVKIAILTLENGSEELVAATDQTSLEFLGGAKIDFIKELGASYFKVINPNAAANCGCGASFSV